MLKGAAKTLTETATQIQPRIRIRVESVARKCVRRRIKENTPTFIETNSLTVEFCRLKKIKIIIKNTITLKKKISMHAYSIYVYITR